MRESGTLVGVSPVGTPVCCREGQTCAASEERGLNLVPVQNVRGELICARVIPEERLRIRPVAVITEKRGPRLFRGRERHGRKHGVTSDPTRVAMHVSRLHSEVRRYTGGRNGQQGAILHSRDGRADIGWLDDYGEGASCDVFTEE